MNDKTRRVSVCVETFPFQPSDFARDKRVIRPDLSDEEQFARWEAELPPHQYWLVNPARDQFETPTDGRGLVDVRALVRLGKAAVDSQYTWDLTRIRDDHLYWSATAYEKLAYTLDDPLPVVFRNIPPNIIRLPLQFERWKHAITIPPDFPSLEVMQYSVEAWATARDLYLSVKEAVKWERLQRDRARMLLDPTSQTRPKDPDDTIGQDFIADTLAANFRDVSTHLEKHQKVPPEFQLIQPTDDVRHILRLIGHQVKHHCRDGVRSRQSMFKPALAVQLQAA
jgi:hypothetical protein